MNRMHRKEWRESESEGYLRFFLCRLKRWRRRFDLSLPAAESAAAAIATGTGVDFTAPL